MINNREYSIWSTLLYDAIWIWNDIIVIQQWRSFGALGTGVDPCGVSCLDGGTWSGNTRWNLATNSDGIYMIYNAISVFGMYKAYGTFVDDITRGGINTVDTRSGTGGLGYAFATISKMLLI